MTGKHKHHYRPVGRRGLPPTLRGLRLGGGQLAMRCVCGTIEIRPDPAYTPASHGPPREVLAWIEARL